MPLGHTMLRSTALLFDYTSTFVQNMREGTTTTHVVSTFRFGLDSKMTKVINLYGGPGTGKSTIAAGLFFLMKSNDISCEMAREYAKDVVWEKRFSVLEDQLYLLAKQTKRIRDLVGQVDYVITDSPILLSVVYAREYRQPVSIEDVACDMYAQFNNIDIFLNRRPEKEYVSKGRLQRQERALRIHEDIRYVFQNYCNSLKSWEVLADYNAPEFIFKEVLGLELP